MTVRLLYQGVIDLPSSCRAVFSFLTQSRAAVARGTMNWWHLIGSRPHNPTTNGPMVRACSGRSTGEKIRSTGPSNGAVVRGGSGVALYGVRYGVPYGVRSIPELRVAPLWPDSDSDDQTFPAKGRPTSAALRDAEP